MTPRPPFVMKPSRGAQLRCDGKFVTSGRASFVWQVFLERRAAGVPGAYEIRADHVGSGNTRGGWHRLDWSPDDAVELLQSWTGLTGPMAARRMLRLRETREQRGLPVG